MIIIGISAYYHDSSACLLKDGVVICAAEEERFSRIKHDKSFPSKAIAFCLEYASVAPSQVDYVVFYEKPFRKFERILRTHIENAPAGLLRFTKAMPSWLKDKLNMRKTIAKKLKKISKDFKSEIRFTSHHQSHAAWCYYQSGKSESAIVVVDAVGESMTTSIWKGEGLNIKCIRTQDFPHSIGLLYSAATYYLGFKVNSDEYKVMGLAPYCKDVTKSKLYKQLILDNVVTVNNDGLINLNHDFFDYMVGDTMCKDGKWEKLFGIKRRIPNSEIREEHMALAYAFQEVTEEVLLNLSATAMTLANSNNICLAGGVSLNCSAIGKLKKKFGDKNVFVPFAPGDDGAAIGAAQIIAASEGQSISSTNPYLGIEYSDMEIENAISKYGLTYCKYENDILNQTIADDLSKGLIVGWYTGRMEFGPRALGNRSILADARKPEMKDKINASVKFRESFRPFAPIVLKEHAIGLYGTDNSPYMTSVYDCKDIPLCPAVTHVDNTARIQTVGKEDNKRLYEILTTYYNLTGCPVLLNTSFNVMGEPIVCSPEDAITTFLNSGIEVLVLNNYVIRK